MMPAVSSQDIGLVRSPLEESSIFYSAQMFLGMFTTYLVKTLLLCHKHKYSSSFSFLEINDDILMICIFHVTCYRG